VASDEPGQRSIVADRDGVIRLWGGEWENLLGYTSPDTLGRKVDLIIPPVLHSMHWRGFNKAIATGRLRRPGKTLKIPAVHKNGAMIPVRASIAIALAEDGMVQGATATLVGQGPAWTGTAWRMGLAPLKLVQRTRGGRGNREKRTPSN
jgi:PAS domain S-box-containing protein